MTTAMHEMSTPPPSPLPPSPLSRFSPSTKVVSLPSENVDRGGSHTTFANRSPALPGADVFPELATSIPGDGGDGGDGDDFLDALLGMDALGVGSVGGRGVGGVGRDVGVGDDFDGGGVGFGGGGGGGGGSSGAAGSRKKRQEKGAGKAWGAGVSRQAFEAEDGGDSVLDDLLGLEVGVGSTPKGAAGEGAVIFPEESGKRSGIAGAGGSADTAGEMDTAAGVFGDGSSAVLTETAGDERRGVGKGGGGEATVAVRPPFDGAELGRLCTHLNDRNRKAKRLAQRCQEMFLRLFFKVRRRDAAGMFFCVFCALLCLCFVVFLCFFSVCVCIFVCCILEGSAAVSTISFRCFGAGGLVWPGRAEPFYYCNDNLNSPTLLSSKLCVTVLGGLRVHCFKYIFVGRESWPHTCHAVTLQSIDAFVLVGIGDLSPSPHHAAIPRAIAHPYLISPIPHPTHLPLTPSPTLIHPPQPSPTYSHSL